MQMMQMQQKIKVGRRKYKIIPPAINPTADPSESPNVT
jgi:hypothetical protein